MATPEQSQAPLILVADDEEDVRSLVRIRLEQAGYRVAVAGDGDEAVRLAADLRPDLAVIDVMMPAKDGYEVVEEMHSADGTEEVPVIMLTARTGEDDAFRGFDAGAAEYITKPFNGQELASRVQSLLRR